MTLIKNNASLRSTRFALPVAKTLVAKSATLAVTHLSNVDSLRRSASRFTATIGNSWLPPVGKERFINVNEGARLSEMLTADELWTAAGPKPTDVIQNGAADCWFMSSLASLAKENPQKIKDMVKRNADGSYAVTLQVETPRGSGKFVPETFNVAKQRERVAGTKDETHATSNDSDNNGHQEVWANVVEDAFKQYMNKYFPEEGMGWSGVDNDYIGRAMGALIGNSGNFTNTQKSSKDQVWDALCRSNQGGLAAAATGKGARMPGLTNDHCYTVIGTQEINGQRYVDLRNPWGRGEPFDNGGPSDGEFRLTLDDFIKNFPELVTTQPPLPQPVDTGLNLPVIRF